MLLTPKVQSIKRKIDKLNFIDMKTFCSARYAVKRMRIQASGWEKNL